MAPGRNEREEGFVSESVTRSVLSIKRGKQWKWLPRSDKAERRRFRAGNQDTYLGMGGGKAMIG